MTVAVASSLNMVFIVNSQRGGLVLGGEGVCTTGLYFAGVTLAVSLVPPPPPGD